MKSWYLAVHMSNGKCILDAVAITKRGMESTLSDFKIMLEKGADCIILKEYEDDNLIDQKTIR